MFGVEFCVVCTFYVHVHFHIVRKVRATEWLSNLVFTTSIVGLLFWLHHFQIIAYLTFLSAVYLHRQCYNGYVCFASSVKHRPLFSLKRNVI